MKTRRPGYWFMKSSGAGQAARSPLLQHSSPWAQSWMIMEAAGDIQGTARRCCVSFLRLLLKITTNLVRLIKITGWIPRQFWSARVWNQCHWAKSQTLARGFLWGLLFLPLGAGSVPQLVATWLQCLGLAPSNLYSVFTLPSLSYLCLPLIGTLVITFRIIQDNVFNLITSASTFFFLAI